MNPVEAAIFVQLNRIPATTKPFWYGLSWVGSPVAIGVTAALALYLKRIRLGINLAVVGTGAWGVSQLVGLALGHRPVPPALLGEIPARFLGPPGFAFPAVHVAIAAALAGVAGPYLGRRLSKTTWVAVVLVGVADVYQGMHLPVGVVAGGFLGWGLAISVHLLGGAPGRRTSESGVVAALADAGLRPEQVKTLRAHSLGPTQLEVVTTSGETLRIEIIRRLRRHAGPLYKIRRLLASVEVEDEPPLSTPRHEAEHEAFVTLLAERAGVRTPQIVLARELEHGPAFLVRTQVDGRPLTEIPAGDIDDALVDEIWRQVTLLGKSRIVHHNLRADNFLVDREHQPWILDLTFARAGAGDERVAQDLAVTLVSLSSVVGVARTLDSARRVLPRGSLERALPYLQALALPRRIRRQLPDERYMLTDLRDSVADLVDRPPPAFRSPIRPATALSLAVGGGAVYLLLPQLSSLPRVFGAVAEANWAWLAVAFLTAVITFPVSTLAFLGSSRDRLPFWRTTAVQVAAAFTGRTTPGGAGFFGLNLIYLERLGIRRANSVGVLVLNRAGLGFASAFLSVISVVAFGLSGVTPRVPSVPTGWPVIVTVVGIAIVAALVVASSFGRRRIVRPIREVTRELLLTVRHPLRATMLLGGSAAFLLLNGLGLVASLAAFRADVPVPYVLAVFIVGFTLSQIAPTPGNLGAMEAILVAGVAASGITATTAVAAVLTFRLITFWLPVVPGIAVFRYLQHRGIV